MRAHLAVLFAVTAVCPTTQYCYTVTETSAPSAAPAESAAGGGTASRSFCSGWEAGFARGWTEVRGAGSAPPAAPSCPQAQCGRDTYEDGYARGLTAGTDQANRSAKP